MGYFSSWLRRTLIAVMGFFAWIKHSYPFVLLPSTLLLFVWLMEYGWLEKTIIFSLGMILVIAEMFNYAIEKLCNVVDSNVSSSLGNGCPFLIDGV